jgi:hypothetical protein
MAITQAMCDVYKRDVHDGVHLPGHTYKMALYTSAATLGAATTAYSATNEVANGGGYTTGGITLTGRAVSLVSGVGILDWTDPVWAAATITARGALIYNDTVVGKPAIGVLDFGADITSTNGNFTVDLPAAGAATSLVRFA